MKERRRAERFHAWFPMRLQTSDEGGSLAVSRNISRTGMLVATAAKLALGAPVTVKFRMEQEGASTHVLEGTIVRFEKNAEDPAGLWPYMVAVEFDEPDPMIEAIAAELGSSGSKEV